MHKKILSKVVTGIMAAMLIFSTGKVVYGGNTTMTTDTAYFDESVGEYEHYTLGRYKANNSSGRVHNISSNYSGATTFYMVASAGDGSNVYYENFSVYPVNVVPGRDAYVSNLVNECGYNYAAMVAESCNINPYYVYFGWRPDTY